ncbi:uncharacterized protein LOC111266662 [Varroa jacobsoni]|uniref:uncharacterized protein LOC111266662 n=1 Tax=Varroa jacobsoni TaxID=62625 RepID=UPI000BF6B614|nr:uncharacterized protein LOC111266662 [Varroa jacobsoni]
MAPTSGVGVGLCASRHRLLAVREKGKKIVNVVIKDDTCANYDGRARRMKIAAEETRPLQTGDTGRLLGAATLVFFFLLLQTALTESVVDSTQHPFTLSTFVVPPATTTIKSTSEVSPSQAVYVPDFPTTGNDLDAEVLQNSTEASTAGDSSAAETQPTTKRPAPVLYRHGKILEVPQAGQDTAAKKVQALRPHRLGLYPTELGPVFEPSSSSEELTPVLPSLSMETFMAFEPISSSPIEAVSITTINPEDVRLTRTVSTPLPVTQVPVAPSKTSNGVQKTVTLFGFVDFTTSLSGTKIIFKPTATRRAESPQEMMAPPAPASQQDFGHLFKSSSLESLRPTKPLKQETTSEKKFTIISPKSIPSVHPSATKTDRYKTGLVKSKSGTTVIDGVTTEFTTLVYGTFIQGSYAHVIRSTSSIYVTPTSIPDASTVTMIGSETSIASLGRPLLVSDAHNESNLMNSASVVITDASLSQAVPSAVIITEGFILPPGAAPPASNSVASEISPTSTLVTEPAFITSDFILPIDKLIMDKLPTEDVVTSSSTLIAKESAEKDDASRVLSSSPILSAAHLSMLSKIPAFEEPSQSMTIEYVAPKRASESAIAPDVEPTSTTMFTTYTHFTTMYNNGVASILSNHEILSNVHTMMPRPSTSEDISAQEQVPSSSIGASENLRHMILIVSPSSSLKEVATADENTRSETPLLPTVALNSTFLLSTSSAPDSSKSPQDATKIETPTAETLTPSVDFSSSYDYTTYTYYTTFIRKGTTSITSRTSVVSNLYAVTAPASIEPTSSVQITEAVTSTYFTTYTYYTTFFRRGLSRIRSREKVETNLVTIFPASTITATTEVLTPITIYKDRSPVVSFAKVPKVYLSTADESTETNRVEPSAIKVTTTFTFFSTTTDPLGRELISTSYSTQEGTLKVDDTQIMPTKHLRTDFTTFTYFSTTTHGLGDTEINSRTEVITRYVPTENVSARKKRDIQQKLETTLTDLVTTFNQGRLVISTRRQTLTRGTLHITNTVALPSVATVAPTAATEVVEDVHIRGHAPLDPRPVDHTYYTTYTYYTTTLNHGLPVTQTRYETVTQVQRINATLGLPAALDYRGSVLCQHCAVKNDLPWVVDGYEKIAPSTIYDHEHRDGGHHTAYSTLTFYTTHYPRGTSYVETHYSVVTNVATTTVTHYMPGLQGPVAPCANHHHTTFTYFTTRYSGPTATVDVQKETVTKCNEPPVVATRTVLAHAVAEASQPVTHDVHSVHSGVREDHQDHIHRPCTVCLPDYGLKTYYTTHTHFTTVLDKHGHPSVSTRYETYSDIFAGVRPTRTRYVRQATSEPLDEVLSPSETEILPSVTTILKSDQSKIYQQEASSHLKRLVRSAVDKPAPEDVYVGRKLLQFQQRQLEPSSSYYLPQFTNYNHAQYVSRILQSSIDNYFNPPQYDFQQYQPFQPYHNQYPYSDYPYDYHSQVPVPPQNDFHQQLAGFQQSFNPPAIEDPSSQQQAQPQAEPPLPHQPPLAPQQQEHQQQTLNVNHFPPLLSYDVDPPKDAKEVLVPNIQASRPSRFIVKSSKLKRKTILRKARPTPTFEFNPTTTEIDTASYVTPMRLRKSSVVRRRPQASEYPEVNPELARIPVLSPAPTPESTFVAQTPTLIRSSRVIPRQRLTSVVIQSSLPQYLFESAQVEELVTPEPKKKPKVKKLPDGTRRIVSSRVQPKLPVPLTSAPPVTFYTTFTYLTTFLHGTHTVYQSRESVVTSIHSGQVDPTLLSQISNGYVDGSTVPVITKTKGLATTIVNLQSRLHIAGDIAPASSIAPTPLIEATSVTPTFDLDQLDNVKKTVYVLQTFMYTVVDEAGVTHTSSKTEIKSNILATPTGLLKIQNTEEMSISNGYLALDNTRTVNLANDVRNGKTTKVDLSLRTVVKLDNVGDAIIRTQPASFEHTLASIEPSITQTTTEYVQVTRPIVSSTDMTRKKIKIKSIVRKRPGVQTSILEPSQLESSFLFEITPALTEPTDSLTELISVTVSPTKQVKRLRVTVRKKASKLVRPVPESSSTFVDQTSATPPQISQPFQVVTKSNKTRLKASKIISRRVRPSDLIRQSPVISVTPVAFTTTTRLPIEVSGSTEYRDVELTTYSLVTSTITPSFFPSSPHLARPIQSSPVVLTYFTTTTYTIPITRNGATTYSTSEHTNSRIVTQYPEPSSLQPSLVLDAALVNELQTPRISDFETKTMFTTYTYYTTYFVNGSTSVISSLNVISNTLQVPLLSILPTPATPLTILKTSERLKVSTSYSTFTFYATLFNGTSSLVTPFEEVQSQVFTLTESFVVTRTVSIAPTAGAALPSDILQSVLPDQPPQEPVRSTQTSSVPSFTLFTLAPGSTSSSRSGPLVPSVKTFLTTFTYFTTFFRQSSSYVVSKESVVTSYATLFVDQAKLKPTTTKRPVSTTTKLDPRVPYTTYTSYTTYTFYTTLFGGKDKIVISSEQIVPQVVTMRLDGSTTKITPTTTQYSTYTAPPVTDDLVPSTETQEVRKPLVTVTSMSSPSASFFSPSSTTTTSTYEVVSRPTETTMTALSETSTVTSSTTERAVETTTTLFTIPTVALPEIIIRDDKPTVSLTKKSSTVTSTAPLTTLPHTQTLILSSSTRFFGRDRRLTHIGSGSILFLITGQDGLLTRSQGLTATASATIATTAIEPTATTTTTTTTATTTTATTTTTTTAATTTTTTTVGATQIAPSNTQPGTILDLTDILGGKGGKLGEAIKGIVNLFNTKNTTTNPDAATSQISRKDSSLPAGPVMVSSQEPVFIPLSPVLDISSFIKPAATSASIAPTSVHSKLTPIYKPDETKEGKGLHISREKLMSDISKAMTKATSAQTSTVASKSIIPSKTTGFETTPLESVSVIVGAETIFFDEGTSTELADSTSEATEVSTSTTGIHPTFVQTVGSAPATVSPSPEVSVEISHESSVAPKYEVQAQSSIVVQPTASSSPVESIVSESSIRPSRPTIYFQVSSTATTPGPKPVSEVDYGGVKVFIAGRGSRKPVEPVIKPENPQTTRKPLPNIFKVGTRKGPGTTTKPPYTGPKVKISFPKPPPAASDIGQTSDDFNDIFSAFQPFNSTIKEQPDGPTPTPLCYPSCDSSRHETCAPNPSKSARNKYICVCRPGYTRDPDGTSNRCIASQTFLLPVHLIRASSKGSAHSQMPRLLHALKVSLEQMYSDHLGFPKGSLLDAKINSVQKVTNYQNESSLALTLVLSQRASNADISLPLLSEQLTRSASALNASLVSLQSPFLLLASAPIEALQDLDECTFADLNDCSYYARCINVPGSFHCECKSGYQDLDVDSPGRTCSSEIKNCQFCSARGSCILGIDNGIEKTTCRCNTMYLGRRCEINGLVLAIALPIALSLLTVTVCCSVKRCRPRYRSATVKPPLPPTKIAMAYPGGGSLLASSDKGHSDKTQMISDSSSEGETSQGGDPHGWHGHGHHPHSHHGPIDGRHTQMSSGGYSGYGDSLAETLSAHPLPSIVIPRVRPKLPARQR